MSAKAQIHFLGRPEANIPFEITEPWREIVKEVELAYFRAVLFQQRYDIAKVAKITGYNRSHMYIKLKKLGLL